MARIWHCASFNTFALGCDPAKGKRTGPGRGHLAAADDLHP